MPDLNYIDGSSGTLKVGATEFSVESWNAKLEAGMNAYTASKNGGWAVHRKSFKKMTGSATILYESDVGCYASGPIPGNTVTLTLIAANTSNFTGNFVIGESDFKWDPSGVAKIDISFGNSGPITTLPS
jgi:hypothetical protein